jgi:tetratricopeptide (TPR) repeat protein
MRVTSSPLTLLVLLAVLGAGVVGIYSPGLHGPFVFDDYPNIVANKLIAVDSLDGEELRDAAYSLGSRPYPHRGLARLSFALNYYFAGGQFDVFAFKLTNVVIHLCNGLLIYWLSVLLLRRYAGVTRGPSAQAGWSAMQSYLPLLVAALWVLHPIQLTSVLYVVQRMTSMAAFFVLAGLVLFVVGRIRLESGRGSGLAWMLAGLAGGVGLGYFCKQNAVLLPFYAFLIELFFFRRETLPVAARRRLYGFYGLTVGLPVLAGVVGLIVAWDLIAQGYAHRDFTPSQRLLTESRVLFFYLGLLLLPHIRSFGLYHDDIVLSTGWLEPWTTLPSVLAWLLLAGLALWGIRRRALWSFALLWYLVGHSLESSVVSLELAFEHRNYLPSFGILFAAAYYLVNGLNHLANGRRLVYPLAGLLVVVLAFITFTRAGVWSNEVTLNLFTAKNHPESYRSLTRTGTLSIQGGGDARQTFAAFARAAAARETTIVPLVEMNKIAAGVSGLLAGGVPPAPGDAPPPDHQELLRAPLVLSVAYMAALETALDAEMARRLAMYPVSAESAYALDNLSECMSRNVDVCLPLADKLARWYEIALDNPRINPEDRAMLKMSQGRFLAARGDVQRALAGMREAIQLAPDNLAYPLNLATLHMQLGQWDEVAEILEQLESRRSWSGFGSRHVRWLRAHYDKHLAATGAKPQ